MQASPARGTYLDSSKICCMFHPAADTSSRTMSSCPPVRISLLRLLHRVLSSLTFLRHLPRHPCHRHPVERNWVSGQRTNRKKVSVVESKFKGSSSTSDDNGYIPHLAFFVRRQTESLLFLVDKDSGVGKESAQAIALGARKSIEGIALAVVRGRWPEFVSVAPFPWQLSVSSCFLLCVPMF